MRVPWRGLVGLSWVVLAACRGPVNATADSGFTEGTRLKAVYFEAEGAPPRFLHWYDTQLGVDCMFADVGLPDRLVCFPTDQLGSDDLFVSEGLVDSSNGCTAPLAPLPACDVHFFARSPKAGDPCGTPVHLFSLWAGVPSDPTSGLADPSCPGLYRLGPEIPLETLVSGTYRPAAGSGRIVPLTIVASDGSVQGAGTTGWFLNIVAGEAYPTVMTKWVAWDTQRKELVSAASWEPDRVASLWHPVIESYTGLFGDAACSVPVAVGPACPLRRPNDAFIWGPRDACGNLTPTSFFELEPPGAVGAGLYYEDFTSGACTSEDPGSTVTRDPMAAGLPLGAPIPPTAFADAAELHTGAKQLQLRQAGTPGGPGAYPLGWGFFDNVHGQPCRFGIHAADGAVRCLPQWPTALEGFEPYFFADAACSIPLVSLGLPSACAPSPSFVRIETMATVDSPEPPPGCGPMLIRNARRVHVYPIGARYLGTVYDNGNFRCVPRENTTPADEVPQQFYELGPEIPAGDFAPMKYVRPS